MMKHYVRLACFVGGALFGSAVQENAADIVASAKDINEARASKEAETQVEGQEA